MLDKNFAYCSDGFPMTFDTSERLVRYANGIFHLDEVDQKRSYLGYEMCLNDLENNDLVQIMVAAFRKVCANLATL